MIGDLFADGVPVGFGVRLIALEIEPHRARVATHKVRNCDGFTMIRQDDPSLQRGEMIRLYLLFQISRRPVFHGFVLGSRPDYAKMITTDVQCIAAS